MDELIKKLTKNKNEINKEIIEELSFIITEKNITDKNKLQEYEEKIFMIDNKKLTLEERIEYCKKSLINSPYDADIFDFEEALEYYKYIDLLQKETDNNKKVVYIAILYIMTGRRLLLVNETYKMIINKEL